MTTEPTANLRLPPGLKAFVEECIHAGDYTSESDVVRDALRLLKREREAFALSRNQQDDLSFEDFLGMGQALLGTELPDDEKPVPRKPKRRTKSGNAA